MDYPDLEKGLSHPMPRSEANAKTCQNTNMLGRHGFMMLYDGLFTLVTFSSHQSSRCLWSGFIEAVLTHPLTRASRASVPPVAAMAAKDPQWAGGVTFGQDGNFNICAALRSYRIPQLWHRIWLCKLSLFLTWDGFCTWSAGIVGLIQAHSWSIGDTQWTNQKLRDRSNRVPRCQEFFVDLRTCSRC